MDLETLKTLLRTCLISTDHAGDAPEPWPETPLPEGDFGLRPDGDDADSQGVLHRPAAVLVPLVTSPAGLRVLLTRRTEHLSSHAGQVSFPGGRVEEQDRSALETALRESKEEIGLLPERVQVAGLLDRYQTITGYLITPVVAFVDGRGLDLHPDPGEVAEIFDLPLSLVLDRSRYKVGACDYEGRHREFYYLEHEEQFIWGATAGMLLNLCLRFARTTKANSS